MDIKGTSTRTFGWLKKAFVRVKSMNPFMVVALIFAMYIVLPPLSGEYNLWNQIKTKHQLAEQRATHTQLSEEIEASKKDLEELRYHKDMLEKYAREEFLMKAENEDLYILR